MVFCMAFIAYTALAFMALILTRSLLVKINAIHKQVYAIYAMQKPIE